MSRKKNSGAVSAVCIVLIVILVAGVAVGLLSKGFRDWTWFAPKNEPAVTVNRLLPEEARAQETEIISREQDIANTSKYMFTYTPFVVKDLQLFSNKRIRTLSFAVFCTGATDANGDFSFQVPVYPGTMEGIQGDPVRVYTLKINAKKYGLAANKPYVGKWIDIDVREYDMFVLHNETIGFGLPDETKNTITPVCIETTAEGFDSLKGKLEALDEGTGVGFYVKGQTPDDRILPWDMEYVSLDDEKDFVKQSYAGKQMSVLGDSISTYGGYSNNTEYNGTIGSNPVYYNDGMLESVDNSYWKRVMDGAGMKLCVNNSWSAGKLYSTGADSGVKRALELDNDNGTPEEEKDDIKPDVVLLYLGVNDCIQNVETGTLYSGWTAAADDKKAETVTTWLKGVKNKNKTAQTAGTTYTAFDEAYALAILNIQTKYPDAKIYCMNFCNAPFLNDQSEQLSQMGTSLGLIADELGAVLVDQTGIYGSTFFAYCDSSQGIHPNKDGCRMTADLILHTMAQELGINGAKGVKAEVL